MLRTLPKDHIHSENSRRNYLSAFTKEDFFGRQGTSRAGIKKERKTEMAYNSSFGKPAPSPGNAEASTSYPGGMMARSRLGKGLTQCPLLLLHLKSAAWGSPTSGMMAR